jgi:hypothetical protein
VHHRSIRTRTVVRAGPCPPHSLFMLRRREDKGGSSRLSFSIAQPQDWLELGSSSGQRTDTNGGLNFGIEEASCPLLSK